MWDLSPRAETICSGSYASEHRLQKNLRFNGVVKENQTCGSTKGTCHLFTTFNSILKRKKKMQTLLCNKKIKILFKNKKVLWSHLYFWRSSLNYAKCSNKCGQHCPSEEILSALESLGLVWKKAISTHSGCLKFSFTFIQNSKKNCKKLRFLCKKNVIKPLFKLKGTE